MERAGAVRVGVTVVASGVVGVIVLGRSVGVAARVVCHDSGLEATVEGSGGGRHSTSFRRTTVGATSAASSHTLAGGQGLEL